MVPVLRIQGEPEVPADRHVPVPREWIERLSIHMSRPLEIGRPVVEVCDRYVPGADSGLVVMASDRYFEVDRATVVAGQDVLPNLQLLLAMLRKRMTRWSRPTGQRVSCV